jgi:hypothetical protein
MTAQPLRLRDSVASGVGYCWLAPVVEMAVMAGGNWPPPPEPGPPTEMDRSKIATCLPGTDPGSVHAARVFTIATLQQWGITDRREDITIVVSELLTNALQHALPCPRAPRSQCPLGLSLLQPGPYVLCAVADPSQQPPVPKEPSYLAETGRGLHLISALADSWGYTTPSDMGKAVWAMFSAKAAPPRNAPCPVQDHGLLRSQALMVRHVHLSDQRQVVQLAGAREARMETGPASSSSGPYSINSAGS